MLGPKSLRANEGNGDEFLADLPSVEAISEYWEGVLGVLGTHNPKDPAIREWREAAKQVEVDPMDEDHDPEYWDHAWSVALKKARKKFPQAAGVLRQLIGRIVNEGSDIPDWLVRGGTVLIPKSDNKADPEKYRPMHYLSEYGV